MLQGGCAPVNMNFLRWCRYVSTFTFISRNESGIQSRIHPTVAELRSGLHAIFTLSASLKARTVKSIKQKTRHVNFLDPYNKATCFIPGGFFELQVSIQPRASYIASDRTMNWLQIKTQRCCHPLSSLVLPWKRPYNVVWASVTTVPCPSAQPRPEKLRQTLPNTSIRPKSTCPNSRSCSCLLLPLSPQWARA